MMTILIFVVLLGVLVFVHELGHFLVARWNGIKADEFGFGFPPRIVGVVKNEITGQWDIVWGNVSLESKNTIYSLNWIPLGGFVKIKGENRESALEPDSFVAHSAWTRIRVLGAGVFMNFLLAWVLFSIVLMVGFPEQIDPDHRGGYGPTEVQILQIQPGTPAETIGLKAGDILLMLDNHPVTSLEFVSEYIRAERGKTVAITVRRGKQEITFKGEPRVSAPEGEGALGISFSETALVRYPWYRAIPLGLEQTYHKTTEILGALGRLIASPFLEEKTALDIAGPIGIVSLTRDMSALGITYLLYFAAILSINLGIINVLPIPALDGGRILFVIIEKLKGSPVSVHMETVIHQVGFIFLILLMVFVTVNDILRLEFWQRFAGWF